MRIPLAAAVVAATLMSFHAHAGEVKIGVNTLNGGTKLGTCHITTFRGPDDAVAAYTKKQKERFADVDPAIVQGLSGAVGVSVSVYTLKQNHCAMNSGVPERIVLTAKGGDQPLLVIPLESEPVKLGNMMGAEFQAVEGHATVAIADVQKLAGKEYDFHLVYTDHKFKDQWKAGYAEKILKK